MCAPAPRPVIGRTVKFVLAPAARLAEVDGLMVYFVLVGGVSVTVELPSLVIVTVWASGAVV